MNDWRITARRITKYDPTLRDNEAQYTKDDWTSYHDVGAKFNGDTLELATYLEIERRYIDAIIMFCDALDCKVLMIGEVEKYTDEGLTTEEQFFYAGLDSGQEIGVENIERLARLILREYMWCELRCSVNPENSIHFGYDYYMYFSGTGLKGEFWDKIEMLGLFVE